MGKKRYYSAEVKWEAVRMKEEGYLNREIMVQLGIKDRTQIQTWMRWYRAGETYRFEQPVGKQYSYQKGISALSETEKLHMKIKQLEMEVELLGKLKGVLGK